MKTKDLNAVRKAMNEHYRTVLNGRSVTEQEINDEIASLIRKGGAYWDDFQCMLVARIEIAAGKHLKDLE